MKHSDESPNKSQPKKLTLLSRVEQMADEYRQEMTESQIKAYVNRLSVIPAELLDSTFTAAMRASTKYMPTAPQILEVFETIGQRKDAESGQAIWDLISDHLNRFGGMYESGRPKITTASAEHALRQVGGWEGLSIIWEHERSKMHWAHDNFLEAHRSYADSGGFTQLEARDGLRQIREERAKQLAPPAETVQPEDTSEKVGAAEIARTLRAATSGHKPYIVNNDSEVRRKRDAGIAAALEMERKAKEEEAAREIERKSKEGAA